MIRMLAIAALALAACPSPEVRAAEMTFYQLPPGAYPHDVAPAPDGSVWISGQRQGFAGRFDPKTGHLEKIALGPGAAPHGVIVGPDGHAWLTEGGQNAIARVDARTKEVKLFPLPKEFSNANLNTLVFDNKGTLWYTGQNGVYGRVDPKTGKVDAWASPKGRGAYGIALTPAAEIWYASLAGDHIARVDTASGEATVVDPPRKGVGPRRIWSDSKGILWVSFWHAGAIGRYDPAAKTWTTYPMPQASPAPTPSMSTTRIGCGRPIGWPMPSSASIRRPKPTRRSRATRRARTCARCSGGRARRGAASPAPTGWW
jgi:virginiamycin B lyase